MLGRKFARKKAHRTHMLRNLAAAVLLYEHVTTTEAKAKEIRSLIDRSIVLAKSQSLAARRTLEGLYFDRNVVKKLFKVLAPRYASRSSGYSRIVRLGNRQGDSAAIASITLMPDDKVVTEQVTGESESRSSRKKEVNDGKK